jgi:trk system potassium uptake protein TrkA
MNILILGAGQVGASLTEVLAKQNNSVTVVDLSSAKLQELQDRFDIRTIHGSASDPDILLQAGLEDTEILIATTQNDDTNILACHFAHILHKTPTKIARIRSNSYLNHQELFDRSKNEDAIPIDVLISPETLVKDHIMQLIEYPGALQVVDFADAKVRIVAIRSKAGSLLIGKQIREIKHHLPKGIETRIVAIYRHGEILMPTGNVVIMEGDEVFFMAVPENIPHIVHELRRDKTKPSRKIMIAGGGNIGFSLAKELEKQHQVKIIDREISRARFIAETLDVAIIIHGNVADKSLLIEENIDEIDLFIAITDSDEANIISGMLAKKLGVKRVISLVNNQSYLDLIQSNSIDIAISANQITTSHLLHYMREEDAVKVSTLRRGAAEAMEVIVHGSENSSKIIGKKIGEINWPIDITIGCVIRDEKVMIAYRDIVIEAEDHIVLFLTDPSRAEEVTKLFLVKEKKSWL